MHTHTHVCISHLDDDASDTRDRGMEKKKKKKRESIDGYTTKEQRRKRENKSKKKKRKEEEKNSAAGSLPAVNRCSEISPRKIFKGFPLSSALFVDDDCSLLSFIFLI